MVNRPLSDDLLENICSHCVKMWHCNWYNRKAKWPTARQQRLGGTSRQREELRELDIQNGGGEEPHGRTQMNRNRLI